MVDRGGLENRCARKGTVGSNPTLSAISPFAEWPKPAWTMATFRTLLIAA